MERHLDSRQAAASKPRIGDLAVAVAHVPWAPSTDVPGRAEAWDAVWDGCYTDYYVCPPGTELDEVDTETLNATNVQIELSDSQRTIVAALYF